MLCDRLKILLQELGISQRQFAMKISLDPAYFSRIVNGTVTPPSRILLLIESVFGVNKQWLEEGHGEIFDHGASLAKRQLLELINTLDDGQVKMVSAFVRFLKEEEAKEAGEAAELGEDRR